MLQLLGLAGNVGLKVTHATPLPTEIDIRKLSPRIVQSGRMPDLQCNDKNVGQSRSTLGGENISIQQIISIPCMSCESEFHVKSRTYLVGHIHGEDKNYVKTQLFPMGIFLINKNCTFYLFTLLLI